MGYKNLKFDSDIVCSLVTGGAGFIGSNLMRSDFKNGI